MAEPKEPAEAPDEMLTEITDSLRRHIAEGNEPEEGAEAEPTGDEPTEEEQPSDDTTQEPEGKEAGDALKPYTDEEVVQILEADEKLDSRRLTPTQKLVQKSFARHAQKGYQEIAEIKKKLTAVEKETAQNQTQPKTIEEAFDRDPDAVLSWLDGQIIAMTNEAEKDPINAIKQLSQLQATRNKLTDRALRTTESRRKIADTATEAMREVIDSIPDFQEKQVKLTEFAINELGYSQDDLIELTNPAKGRSAAKVVKTINAAYDALYGKKEKLQQSTAQKKVVKMPIVEGAGKKENQPTNDATMRKAFAKAKATGDWTEYLNLKGVLPRLTS